MSKYQRLREALERTGEGAMKVFGNSMLPLIKSGSTLKYRVQESYEIGDVVFCKVRGRYIDAHKITAISGNKYLISNNRGHDNGWTRQIFAKVVEVER